MAFDFATLNSSDHKKTVRDGISTKELPEVKISDFIGKEIPVDGFFINSGKNGDWVVVITDGKKVSMPTQYTDQFKAIRDNDEALKAMMDGKLKLVNIRAYTTKEKRNTHLLDFATV